MLSHVTRSNIRLVDSRSLDTKHVNEGILLNEVHDVKSLLPFFANKLYT